MIFTIPTKTVSEANQREHWRARNRRKKLQQAATILALRQAFIPMTFPLLVKMTRLTPKRYPRTLDSDNCAGSFKHIRDAICRELNVDDGDIARVRFEYGQRVGEDWAVEVEIVPG